MYGLKFKDIMYLVVMTVVLHNHKIVHGKRGVYIYLLQKDTCTVAISFECLIFREKLEDIK